MEKATFMGFNIIVSEYMPSNTIMISPDTSKYFKAVLDNDKTAIETAWEELLKKTALLKNIGV